MGGIARTVSRLTPGLVCASSGQPEWVGAAYMALSVLDHS